MTYRIKREDLVRLYFCRFLRVLPTIVGLVIGLILVLKVLVEYLLS
jgi:hypothetical protein